MSGGVEGATTPGQVHGLSDLAPRCLGQANKPLQGASQAYRANDLRRRCSTFLSFLSESLDRHRVPPPSEAAEENAQNSLRCASAADLRLPSEMELLELGALPAAPSAGLRPSTAQSRASASRDLRRLTEIRQHRADLRTRAAHWLRSLQPRARDSSSLLQLGAADKDGGSLKRKRRPDEAGRSEGAAAYRSLSPALRVPADELVLRVTVMAPHSSTHPSEDWLVLTGTPLCALRDAIFCLATANAAAVDAFQAASTPAPRGRGRRAAQRLGSGAQGTSPATKLTKPSAYFYFEGIFYNDERDSAARDYSLPVRQACTAAELRAPPHPAPGAQSTAILSTAFEAAPMQTATWGDVWIKMGPLSPGLFCHQGGCEHLVVVAEARRFDPEIDAPRLEDYPCRVREPTFLQKRNCYVCEKAPAQWVTHEDKEAADSPFFWCHNCYKSMHYNDDGDPVYSDYRVLPYTQDYHSVNAALAGTGGFKRKISYK